jgi:ABC-2 type transport system permease protein
MRAFLALMRREFIEHRISFLYAPLVILVLVTLLLASGMASGQVDARIYGIVPASPKFYELFYALIAGAWWIYLIAGLAFYCSDAFAADRRNASLLFWKSMPQGDTKILWSKMAAALSLFPALVFVTVLASGLVAIGFAGWASHGILTPQGLARSFFEVSLVAVVYLVISVLWYAPFFAWVGGLATIFGRWSIPLALLVPGVLALIEEVYHRSSFILDYIRARANLEFSGLDLPRTLLLTPAVDAGQLVPRLVAGTDWVAVATGLAFTVLVVTLAGQYRRRTLR